LTGIEFRDVHMEFGERRHAVKALAATSLVVPRGRFACLVGPSGCGKSTLLMVGAGLLEPTGGEVLLDGRRVHGAGADRGMVFQSYSLYPWLSVRRNVEFGPELRGLARDDRRRISDELLRAMGLEGFAEAYPKALSGGMRQRVAIARALANDPEVLFMGEPFGALDAQTRRIMQQLLTDIWHRYQKTVLFVTHDIDEAVFLGDVVYCMSRRPGRITRVIEVDIPRPRSFETLETQRFSALRLAALQTVHEESVRAMESEFTHPRP
jgi:ABC-type nitrate/sulfonate/bicarbonate transport system ATPase subunit